MTEIVVLQRDERKHAQVVQLSAEYHPENWDNGIRMMLANLWPGEVDVVVMTNSENPISFSFTEDEMNTLCTAWQSFKAELKAKEEAEQERIKHVETEAYKLAESIPGLNIKKHDNYAYWDLEIPKLLSWLRTAYTADELLSYVEQAQDIYWPYREAKDIAKTCPVIKVKRDGNGWFVSVAEPNIFGQWAYSTKELLSTVIKAKERYERYQIEQAYKIAQECPAIHIELLPREEKNADTPERWRISAPSLGDSYRYIAYRPDMLLACVKECQEAYQKQQGHKQAFVQAQDEMRSSEATEASSPLQG